MIGEGVWPAAPMKNNTIDQFKTLKVGMCVFVCLCGLLLCFVGFCCVGPIHWTAVYARDRASIIFHEMVPTPTRACAARFA